MGGLGAACIRARAHLGFCAHLGLWGSTGLWTIILILILSLHHDTPCGRRAHGYEGYTIPSSSTTTTRLRAAAHSRRHPLPVRGTGCSGVVRCSTGRPLRTCR